MIHGIGLSDQVFESYIVPLQFSYSTQILLVPGSLKEKVNDLALLKF